MVNDTLIKKKEAIVSNIGLVLLTEPREECLIHINLIDNIISCSNCLVKKQKFKYSTLFCNDWHYEDCEIVKMIV